MKTPTMDAALAPIYAILSNLKKAWEEGQLDAKIDTELAEFSAKDAKKKIVAALKVGNREEARRLVAEQVKKDEEIPEPRLTYNDSTVEKLGVMLNENHYGLLLVRDELSGFLAKMESEEYQNERAFYLQAFKGFGPYDYDRIGRGHLHIGDCTLSIIGGIQPARIAPLVRGAAVGVSDDGLIQRFQLAVWPDDLATWRWVNRRPDMDAKNRYEAVFCNMHDLARGLDKPVYFTFSNDAQDMFREWVQEIMTEARAPNLAPVLQSHFIKMQKTIASLALIFELVGHGHDVIGAKATARAIEWADYLKSHAIRLMSDPRVSAWAYAKKYPRRRSYSPTTHRT